MPYNERGFTLIEIAIVLTVLGILAAVGLSFISDRVAQNKFDITQKRIAEIADALEAYAESYIIGDGTEASESTQRIMYLPCPTAPNSSFGDANFGRGVNNITDLGTGVCPFADAWPNVFSGSVPYADLGLSYEHMFDGWGRRFTYRVGRVLTGRSGTKFGQTDINNPNNRTNMQVRDRNDQRVNGSNLNAPDIEDAAFVIISHGRNGLGAYTARGGLMPDDGASLHERDNMPQGTNGQITRKYDYVTNDFDDIVEHRSVGQLITKIK